MKSITGLSLFLLQAQAVWHSNVQNSRLESRSLSRKLQKEAAMPLPPNVSPLPKIEQVLLQGRKNYAYGTCNIAPTHKFQQLAEGTEFMKKRRSGSTTYKCYSGTSVTSGTCTCSADEMLLYNFENSQIEQSCCPLEPLVAVGNLQCSGCAKFVDGGCSKCMGGFTKMGSGCVFCKNEVSFVDNDGNTCADYENNLWCVNGAPASGFESKAAKKFKHLSADESCCVCGGGFHKGTPFEYRVERLNNLGLAGTKFEAYPYPRTANQYILGSDCELEKFGLTIDQGSGVISGTPTSEEPFEIQCQIKAVSDQAGNNQSSLNPETRDFTTNILISTKAFGYEPSDAITVSKRATSAMIFDEYHISRVYNVRWAPTVSAANPSFTITCAPKLIIHIDTLTGAISLGNITLAEYKAFFRRHHSGGRFTDPHETPSGHEKVMRSNCHVTAVDDNGTPHYLDVKVFAYPPFPEGDIAYHPVNELRVTVGQPVVEPLQLGVYSKNKTKHWAIPGLYSVNLDCKSDIGKDVVYEMGTGHISIEGLPVVTINPVNGALNGSPHVGLRKFMPSSWVRSYFTIGCDIYAAVPTASLDEQDRLYKSASKLVIQVDSDHCWVNADTYSTPQAWTPALKSTAGVKTATAAECKALCGNSLSCAGYYYAWVPDMCYELVITPPDVQRTSWSALSSVGKGNAKLKIDNCQLHQTCVEVTIVGKKYLSGNYCPLLSQMESNPHPVYEMPGHYKEDTFYLMKYDKYTEAHQPLPKGCTPTNTAWVFRRASNAGGDVVDVEKNYIEMHGEIEACLLTDLLEPPAYASLLQMAVSRTTLTAHVPANASESKSEQVPVTIAQSHTGALIETRLASLMARSSNLDLPKHSPALGRAVSPAEKPAQVVATQGGVSSSSINANTRNYNTAAPGQNESTSIFAGTLNGKSHVHTPYPTQYPTKYPTKYPTPRPTTFPTKYPTQYPTKYPTPRPTVSPATKTPTCSPTTKSPTLTPTTNSPTRNPTTISPTKSPITENPVTINPSESVHIRAVYDSVPLKLTEGRVSGSSEYRGVDISPIGKTCFSPLYKEDEEKEKSSSKDDGGNDEEVSEQEEAAETGLIIGSNSAVKEIVFKFDDPNTVTAYDYHLHPCECGFEAWGENLPVTKESFEAASLGAIDAGMSFNRFVPDAVQLWMGPFVCEQYYLISSIFDPEDCAIRCNELSNCNYFVKGEGPGGRFCYLYSKCEKLMRVDTDFLFQAYALYKPSFPTDVLCHIADPENCWASTRRRAYLTQKSHPYGTCMWENLLEQCDFAMLMGDGEIEFCGRCTYMQLSSQDQGKRSMPEKFPHGATLKVDCSEGYSLVSSAANDLGDINNAITCIDGEWRDTDGEIGLIGLQCSACVQVFGDESKSAQLVPAGLEELIFIGRRSIGLFFMGDDYYPEWVEVEGNSAISTNSARNLGTFTWSMTLDRTTAVQLEDPISKKCLAIRDYPIGTKGMLDVLRLSKCQIAINSFLETSETVSEISDEDDHTVPPPPPPTGKGLSEIPSSKRADDQFLDSSLYHKIITKSPTAYPTKYPTPSPTKFPTPAPTQFPTGIDKVMMLPKDAFQRVSKQRETISATSYNSGWNCASDVGFLTKTSHSGKCLKRHRTSIFSRVTDVLNSGSESVSLNCKEGEGMFRLYATGSTHAAYCSPIPGLGECVVKRFTFESTTFSPLTKASERSQKMECNEGEVVSGWEAEGKKNSAGYTNTISLKCCVMPFYSGFILSTDEMTDLKSYEGLYCPYGYDDLLRPKFKQTLAYGNYLITEPTSKLLIDQSARLPSAPTIKLSKEGVFNRSTNQNVQISNEAAPKPSGLLETDASAVESGKAFDEVLQAKAPSRRPTRYPTPNPTRFPTPRPTKFPTPSPTRFPTPFPRPGQVVAEGGSLGYNKDEDKWCLTVSGSVMCSTHALKAVHPKNVHWLAENGKHNVKFAVDVLEDMIGEGMTGSTSLPDTGSAKNPPKPTLVEFNTVDPTYSEGCVKISEDKFTEAAEIFPPDDPCGFVANRKWTEKGSEEGPGQSYESLIACSERELERVVGQADRVYDGGVFENVKNLFYTHLKNICPNIPEPKSGGGGGLAGPFLGLSFKTPKLCKASLDNIHTIAMASRKIDLAGKTWNRQIASTEDCAYNLDSTQRILCDLHCVSDAVKAGTHAEIHNIKMAAENILQNSRMLMDYYATVIMNKVTNEVGSLKSKPIFAIRQGQNVTVTEYVAQLKEDMGKYLLPNEIMNVAQDQVDPLAVNVLLEAQQTAQEIIGKTQKNIQEANMENEKEKNEALAKISRALARLDVVLASAHNRALQQQKLRMQGKTPFSGSDLLKTRILKAVSALNNSYTVDHIIHVAHRMTAKSLRIQGKALVESARLMSDQDQMMGAKLGVLNTKIDILLDEFKAMKSKMKAKKLDHTLQSLATYSIKMHDQVDRYVGSADTLFKTSHSALLRISDYLKCHSDPSFIRMVSKEINDNAGAAQQTLRKVFPAALNSLRNAVNTLVINDVMYRSVKAAVGSLVESGSEAKDSKAGHLVSTNGLKEMTRNIYDKIDGLPLDISNQVLSMFSLGRFLHTRMSRDEGLPPSEAYTDALVSSFDSFKRIQNHLATDLADPLKIAKTIQSLVDSQLTANFPAPASCRSLAFEKYGEPSADSLVVLAKKGNMTIVSQPYGVLLTYHGNFRVPMDSSSDFDSFSTKFPSDVLRFAYVCEDGESSSQATLTRVTDWNAKSGSVLSVCNMKSCVGREGMVQFARWAQIKHAITTAAKSSQFLQMFGEPSE